MMVDDDGFDIGDLLELLIGAAPVVIVICFVLFVIYKFSTETSEECGGHTSLVASIGGCDRDGDCGVMLQDGTTLRNVRQPVVGSRPHGPGCRERK